MISKPTKSDVMRELRDYIFITLGLISYALGWTAFLIPYQITTGGTPYRCHHLLCNRFPHSMVLLHHQRCPDDICY